MADVQKMTLGAGEALNKVLIPSAGTGETAFSLEIGEGASADIVILVLPGVSCSLSFRISLVGKGADCRLSGIYLCPDKENVKINVELSHKVAGCTSRQLFKGIVSGVSRTDFFGRIIVAPGAQKTEAYQENHSLLLSDTAKVSTMPQLEIYADDVKCSHGATIGRLNEEEQFYMRSRGISLDEARALQMISFISPVFWHIPSGKARDEALEMVEEAIRNRF